MGQSPHRYQHIERSLQDAGGRDSHLALEVGAGPSFGGHLTHVSAEVDDSGQAGQRHGEQADNEVDLIRDQCDISQIYQVGGYFYEYYIDINRDVERHQIGNLINYRNIKHNNAANS